MPFPTVPYAIDTPAGYPGMIATTEPHWITSNIVGSASGDIAPGKAVIYDTVDGTVKLPTATGKFAGIAVVDRTLPFSQGNVFKPYDQINTMKTGCVWVAVSAAVAQGDPVYYVNATGAIANVSTSATLIENAEFMDTTAGAGIARIRLGVSK